MYCPNCANPIDGTQKFCRACGANVSLVPQALTGKLPEANQDEERRRGRRRDRHRRPSEPSIERAAGNFFSGIGFILASLYVLFYFPGGFTWGWAFLFPAFALIGEGVGQYLKVKELERQRQRLFNSPAPQMNLPSSAPPQAYAAELSAPTTSELQPPPSVAEHTTKHLDPSRPRQ